MILVILSLIASQRYQSTTHTTTTSPPRIMNHTEQSRTIAMTIDQLLDVSLEESISSYNCAILNSPPGWTLEQEDQWRRYNPPSAWHEIISWHDPVGVRGDVKQRTSELDHNEHLVSSAPTQKPRNKKARQANISSNKAIPSPARQDRQTKINESQYWKKRRTVARQRQSKNRLSDHFEEYPQGVLWAVEEEHLITN